MDQNISVHMLFLKLFRLHWLIRIYLLRIPNVVVNLLLVVYL